MLPLRQTMMTIHHLMRRTWLTLHSKAEMQQIHVVLLNVLRNLRNQVLEWKLTSVNRLGSASESNSVRRSMDKDFRSEQEYGNDLDKEEESTSVKPKPSYRGPFSVVTLLYTYLEQKQKKELDKILTKYGVKIDCTSDQTGGQGEVYITGDGNRSAKQLDEAAEEFISLYQRCYQNVIIKPVACEGVGSQVVDKATSYIWTKHPSVLVESSIEDEVTFIGTEGEVMEAIRMFQRNTGLQPKLRKLKHSTGASSSPMPSSPLNTDPEQERFGTSNDKLDFAGATSWEEGSSSSPEHRHRTDEGVEVIAVKDDITKQPVDVIVNPSNGDLTLSEGVGGALLRAAGYELAVECNEARQRNRFPFSEAECVATKGYKLSARNVVHAVGPSFSSNNENAFYSKLKNTFDNCLSKANELKAQSIAVPLMGSGMLGGPKELCSKALIDAVKCYSKMEPNKTIKHVLLVNKDTSAYDAVAKMMTWLTTNDNDEDMDTSSELDTSSNAGPGTSTAFWTEKLPTENTSRMGSGASSSRRLDEGTDIGRHRVGSSDDSGMEKRKSFTMGKLRVIVEQQHVLESLKEVDCVIIPLDRMLNSVGEVAQTVVAAAGLTKDALQEKTSGFGLRDGEILHMHGNDLGSVTIVFLAITEKKSYQSNFFDIISNEVCNSLKYADGNRNLRSVTLPLLPPNVCQMEVCSEVFVKAIRRFSDFGPRNIRQIHVVSDDNESNMSLQCTFGEEFKDAGDDFVGSSGSYAMGGGSRASGKPADVDLDDKGMGNEWAKSRGSNSMDTHDKDTKKGGAKDEESDEEDTRCPICLEDFGDDTPPVNQGKCKHKFCQGCLDEFMKRKPVCPVCGVVYGMMKGNQPPGQMSVSESSYGSLPGYERCGIITIRYSFGGGTQGPDHPEPGRYYSGTGRTAYLPNNAEGKKVLGLLKKAFDAKLVFTIGTSVTTGASNVVTWNDIHHKTSMSGGPQSFGYPDPTYLSRVTEELAAKGIK